MNYDEQPSMTPDDAHLRDRLLSAFPSAKFPRSDVRDRIRVSIARETASDAGSVAASTTPVVRLAVRRALPSWARAGLAIAAALALFVGGAEYGRRTTLAAVATAPPPTGYESGSLPLAIQGTGTRYVATLARLAAEEADLSEAERRVALEVALGALYAASIELLRQDTDDGSLRAVAELVARRRNELEALSDDTSF